MPSGSFNGIYSSAWPNPRPILSISGLQTPNSGPLHCTSMGRSPLPWPALRQLFMPQFSNRSSHHSSRTDSTIQALGRWRSDAFRAYVRIPRGKLSSDCLSHGCMPGSSLSLIHYLATLIIGCSSQISAWLFPEGCIRAGLEVVT